MPAVAAASEVEPPAPVAGLTSVVIPAWGAHVAYVPDAVASLRAQGASPIEIIVADNASDPPVGDLGEGVRVARSAERLTPGGIRNFGLERARGEYVVFWDADDLMLAGALDRMRAILERDPDAVAVTMHSVTWTPETGPGVRWPWPRSAIYRLSRFHRLLAVIALVHNPFTTTGPALMRTAAVRDARGFAAEIAYFEDWALAASLAVRGRVVMVPEIARLYRVHDQSLSLGHLDSPEQGAWLRGMRDRARRDPRVPIWMKALLPLVWLSHLWRRHRRVGEGVGAGYYKSALEQETGAPGA